MPRNLLTSAALAGACALLLACGASEAGRPATETPTAGPSPESALDGSRLRVAGRDSFRACIETVGEDVTLSEEAAAAALQEALDSASSDERWPEEFGTPRVDIGCPLPPVSLAEEAERGGNLECSATVSDYLVFVFVADRSDLDVAFPYTTVRKLPQEGLQVSDHVCDEVSEAWYVTPDELNAEALGPYTIRLMDLP